MCMVEQTPRATRAVADSAKTESNKNKPFSHNRLGTGIILGQANSIRSLLSAHMPFVHTLQLSYFIMITCFNSKEIRVVNSVMYL